MIVYVATIEIYHREGMKVFKNKRSAARWIYESINSEPFMMDGWAEGFDPNIDIEMDWSELREYPAFIEYCINDILEGCGDYECYIDECELED